METTSAERRSNVAHHPEARRRPHGVDTTLALTINGTTQRVRLCAERSELPPVLIVQAGPGLPVVNEVRKFQERLHLEDTFSVAYWDQRGCGPAPLRDVRDISFATQVDDVRAVVRWLAGTTGQPVVVLGISLGATAALRAAAFEPDHVKALVAVSIDTDLAAGDASAFAYLQEAGARADQPKLARSIRKLGAPPYTTPAPIQLRARLLTDLGGVERGKRFGDLLRELLFSLVRTYGLAGAVATLRNMNAIQRRMLPELADLNLLTSWPRAAMPVHYVFGHRDPLVPPSLVRMVSSLVADGDTVTVLPEAGHMAHFDEPAIVRSIVLRARES